MGIILGTSVLANSMISCYAATSSIEVEMTATRAYGKFSYFEAGHQIKVTVYYQEKNNTTSGIIFDTISDVQNGNVTVAVASKSNTAGYKFIWGQAFGYVDGEVKASSAESYVGN